MAGYFDGSEFSGMSQNMVTIMKIYNKVTMLV
jgi:hypothetical protein